MAEGRLRNEWHQTITIRQAFLGDEDELENPFDDPISIEEATTADTSEDESSESWALLRQGLKQVAQGG